MAAKRVAGRQLTDQNWEEEDEPEEAGVFTQAAQEVIKTREIKKAKRRVAGTTGGDSSSGNSAFKGFAGFTGLSSTTASKPAFGGFGSTASKPLGGLTNGGSSAATTTKPTFSFGSGPSSDKPLGVPSKPPAFGEVKSTGLGISPLNAEKKPLTNGTKDTETSKSAYLAQLRSLNEGVTKWIKDHVDKNPYCVLTPIFKDYEKYLADIEKKYPDHGSDEDAPSNRTPATSTGTGVTSSAGGFKVTAASTTSKSGETPAAPSLFSFGATGTSSLGGGAASGFSFGTSGSSTSATSGFSFKPSSDSTSTASTGFSFATSKPATQESQESEKGEEEYVPPKPEAVDITEEDAFYTKRCKLFYQKGGAWMERGVGNLYLKPCNDKTQLLMRADTALGTILLNIMVTGSIPFKRQGKNNVSFICIPNPPIDPDKDDKKPCSMMIRVKTAEDADELAEKLEENKK